ncbi:elongation factor P [Mycoplasmoides fastidiosum]|uniref:Elongation factor P n=1 Tax=Mycoplasmoides fastidiosum TaxID=92758 RepID=A0ABU0LZL1_9BACT|nr:elongation factor P [Mycoplasmoides fastidiosum]MDQ0514141.1 elongation factor P [Mycoplasmoides fastidiosum]UUD37451.1 elongation factor P [Mycoplasmoides fastidiosum]
MANFIPAKDLRSGHTIVWKNDLYQVLDHSFNKTAMRGGIVKCKIKNLKTGAIITQEFTGERLEQAVIDRVKANYSYESDNGYIFYNATTFDEIIIAKDLMNWEKNFLSDNLEVTISLYENRILGINLPETVSVLVVEAEDAVKGDTATALTKKAWLESGLEVIVPQFIKSGEVINVSTVDGKYKSR